MAAYTATISNLAVSPSGSVSYLTSVVIGTGSLGDALTETMR